MACSDARAFPRQTRWRLIAPAASSPLRTRFLSAFPASRYPMLILNCMTLRSAAFTGGDFLGRMHSLTFDQFGDVAEREGEVAVGAARELAAEAGNRRIGPFSTWREMHQEIVRGRLAFLSRTEFHDLIKPMEAWFDKSEGLLDYPITPRLLHTD